jgi:biotin operon repressor
MRADRLVSLVLLLRRHGQLSAATLARELEVSTRTVLRDIEALSAAGVPVYAERGRNGGFALLPGFRTELTGLNHDEALALLIAGSRRGAQAFGLGSALASAMLKVVDALPESHREAAAGAVERLLVDPETDLLSRRVVDEEVDDAIVAEVRRAVFAGRKLRIHYAAVEQTPRWRTVDPIGLVTVRGQLYLLATRSGADRDLPVVPGPGGRGARRARAARGASRSGPDVGGARHAIPDRRRPTCRAGAGRPGAAGRPAGHRLGRPLRGNRRGRPATTGGDVPGRTTR